MMLQPSGLAGSELEENEIYLGGFYSSLQLTLGMSRVGAGIYATNRRLFIFRENVDLTLNRMVSGSARKDFAPRNLTPEQNSAIIKELSSHCPPQLGLRLDQISSLELKAPPGVFRMGYLKLTDISGGIVKMGIGKKGEYEYVRSLLQSFYPEVVRVVQ